MPLTQPAEFRTSKGQVVRTLHTLAEAAEVLAAVPPTDHRFSFAHSLRGSFLRGRLSANQTPWVYFLAEAFAPSIAPEPNPAPRPDPNGYTTEPVVVVPVSNKPEPSANLPGIVQFLTPASMKRRSGAHVVFRVGLSDGQGTMLPNGGMVSIKRSDPRRSRDGKTYFAVSDGGPYGRSTYYGRINEDGKFYTSKDGCPVAVLALLDEFEASPVSFVMNNGLRTGRCCFCDARLDDPISYKIGYGPVCAKHYGLPHGKKGLKLLESGQAFTQAKAEEPTTEQHTENETEAYWDRRYQEQEARQEAEAFLSDPDYRRG